MRGGATKISDGSPPGRCAERKRITASRYFLDPRIRNKWWQFEGERRLQLRQRTHQDAKRGSPQGAPEENVVLPRAGCNVQFAGRFLSSSNWLTRFRRNRFSSPHGKDDASLQFIAQPPQAKGRPAQPTQLLPATAALSTAGFAPLQRQVRPSLPPRAPVRHARPRSTVLPPVLDFQINRRWKRGAEPAKLWRKARSNAGSLSSKLCRPHECG